jgi:histidine ammonia-lyase
MAMVVLDGKHLTIDALHRIACLMEKVKVKSNLWHTIDRSRTYIKNKSKGGRTVYGFNTGFGALAHVRINARDLAALQKNILLSHNAGVGEAFEKKYVRAALALRINTLIKGYSGVSCELVRHLVAFLNHDIIPIVPSQGSVGASGDLAPMAALGCALIGEGKVLYKDKKMPATKAMTQIGLRPLVLREKEGLSLINGTQFSTALAGLVHHESTYLCDIADVCGSLSLDALRCSKKPFHPVVSDLRPHQGARVSAARLRKLLQGSAIMRSHAHCTKVQDPYSLRCMSQIHGAVRDVLSFTGRTITIEMNSVTDNPLVCPDHDLIVSNGNFHGEPISFSLDFITIGLAELGSISERRVFRLLDSKLSGLNAFLTKKPGLNSGFMMAQVTAAALVSQNKVFAHPASVDSIPTSANQEDHVSMSMNAGLKALEVIENTKYVLAIELLCACQALDLLTPLRTSPALQKVKGLVRKKVPFITKDHPLADEIEKLKDLIDRRNIS